MKLKMKKLTLAASLLLALISFTNRLYGQQRMSELMNETTPEERAKMQTDYMKESLSLTEDQTSQIAAINLKHARKMQDVYNSGGSRIQKLKKMKSVSQEKDNEIKGALTPDKYAAYEKNKAEMKERFKEKAKEKRKE
jgi:hypothetical protein